MLNFGQLSLFNNANAHLRVTIHSSYRSQYKVGQETRTADRIHIRNGNGIFRPFAGLGFSYLTNDFRETTRLTLVFPLFYVYRLREVFRRLSKYLTNLDKVYSKANGVLSVMPQFQNPLLVEVPNSTDWLTFTLAVSTFTDYYGKGSVAPSVAIGCSKFVDANGQPLTAHLDVEEFLSLADEIIHLDYASVMYQLTILYLVANDDGAASSQQPQQQYYQKGQPSYQPRNNYQSQNENSYKHQYSNYNGQPSTPAPAPIPAKQAAPIPAQGRSASPSEPLRSTTPSPIPSPVPAAAPVPAQTPASTDKLNPADSSKLDDLFSGDDDDGFGNDSF